MLATLLAAAVICGGSLLVGQAVCHLAGYERWTWISPAVGFSLLMLIATAALHLPGRAATTAAVCLALAIASGVVLVRRASLRPPPGGILIGLPALLAALIPFAANGRFGTLGWSFNNDMSVHLLWADLYRSKAVAAVNALPSGYPLGPHALVASVAQGLGLGTADAFTGFQIAVVIITAWTALSPLQSLAWWRRAVVATITANVYMLASYYGEGAFKETTEAMLALAFALALRELLRSRRWAPLALVPLALILAASLATYSYTGLIWPGATVLVLAAGAGAHGAANWSATRRRLRQLWAALQGRALPLGLAALVCVVVLIPELPRLVHFFQQTNSGDAIVAIPKGDLGPLPQKLSGWEVFGIWTTQDFRFLPMNQLHQGLWTAVGVAGALWGLLWWLRRRDFVLPAAVIAAFGVYALANKSQSPYVVAKALVIISPMLVLLAGRALLDTEPALGVELRALSLGLAALLFFGAAKSSYQALRFAVVGGTAHARELATLKPLLRGKRVLYLGADDFIFWELSDARVTQPVPGTGPEHAPSSAAKVALRKGKASRFGYSFDFDSIEPASYDQFGYVIAPRDGRLSGPPANLVLVRQTQDYELFRRVGPTPRRRILDEGTNPGAVLQCRTPAGRRIAALAGVAAIREAPIALPLPQLGPGGSYAFSITLPAGRWLLTMPYVSPQPITLSVAGRQFHLPASIDRLDVPGTGWPAGGIALSRAARVDFTVKVHDTLITGLNQPVYLNSLAATREEADRLIPLHDACGSYVDWYLPA